MTRRSSQSHVEYNEEKLDRGEVDNEKRNVYMCIYVETQNVGEVVMLPSILASY